MNGDKLRENIEDSTARVGVIGLGYVGLPLSSSVMKKGFSVVGFDVDPDKIQSLKDGRSYVDSVSSDHIQKMLDHDRFHPTDNFDRLEEVDIILICVPTPLKDERTPNLEHIQKTGNQIRKRLRPGQLVILESTTYPGTTRDELVPVLNQSGLEAGEDFFVAYSPEREDPGNEKLTMEKIPKVVGGINEQSSMLARAFYQRITVGVVDVDNPEVAEATKLLENIYRAVNIALVNELKIIFSEMDIDVWKVIEAASTKPFGYHPFYPGPGLGGHCIPIDPFYLSWKAEQHDMEAQLINLAGKINTSMPGYILDRITEALEKQNMELSETSGLVLGVAYKRDVDDTRGSPAFEIMKQLEDGGGEVDYHDPHVPKIEGLRHYDFEKESVSGYPEIMSNYDFVVITTDHSFYDPEEILEHGRLVFDSRNLTKDVGSDREDVWKV